MSEPSEAPTCAKCQGEFDEARDTERKVVWTDESGTWTMHARCSPDPVGVLSTIKALREGRDVQHPTEPKMNRRERRRRERNQARAIERARHRVN